jgi:1,4-dihydroxy-2-naphthoate octaprenyltransferase
MPRPEGRGTLDLKVLFADDLRDSRSAEDPAKNGSDAIIANDVPNAIVASAALVSIVGVLPIALFVAAHKALTKSLR